ncbi:LysR family transcriptional regulator [Avibacterium volantium]|uniref:HTH-type transcriptional activator AllS n=1 Tax=Avibacterium volantium TaxID=762 RepID=A0A3S4J8L3_AVIVO|nr:LysR family transcriptional regulator [Avibacterium volantium]VEB22905.1 HTH-type transcriptional activator AllS [Avibacterium volantium]
MSKFDINAIETFLTLAENGSFSVTAKKLHKTTATITYRVKTLESHLNVALFHRNTRQVRLTKEGEHLKQRLEMMLDDMNNLKTELVQIHQNIELSFDISINNLMYDKYTVSALLGFLSKNYPKTHFRVRREVYNGVWSRLLSEKSDFAIGAPGWTPISNRLDHYPMGELIWVFVASPKHPIRHYHGLLSNDILRQFTAINVADTSIHIRKRKGWLLKGQHEIVVPNLATKLAMHIDGIGVGFLPYFLAKPYLDSGQLIARQVVHPRANSPFCFSWLRKEKGHITQTLATMIKEKHPIMWNFTHHLDLSKVSNYDKPPS